MVAQFALMLAVFLAVLVPPSWPDAARTPLAVVGALLAVGGVAVVVAAARALGRGLTPFPEPPAQARLVVRGPFRVVRHPTYGGGLLFLVGWSLFAGPVALGLTAALGLLWVGKTRAEERRLRARFPDYAAYCERVPFRLVPWVF